MIKNYFKPLTYSILSFVIVLAFGRNIIISIICFLVCFICSYMLFKVLEMADLPTDKLERIEIEREKTKEEELKELTVSCKNEIRKIRDYSDNISDAGIKECINDIYEVSNKILDNMTINHLSTMNNFFDYYIPETQKILEKYMSLKIVIESDNDNKDLSSKILTLLKDISGSLKKILKGMFKDDLNSIETDIEVLKNTLKTEGLTNDYDKL